MATPSIYYLYEQTSFKPKRQHKTKLEKRNNHVTQSIKTISDRVTKFCRGSRTVSDVPCDRKATASAKPGRFTSYRFINLSMEKKKRN